MHELPEAPDRMHGRRMRKEKKPSQQKKELCFLSAAIVGLRKTKFF